MTGRRSNFRIIISLACVLFMQTACLGQSKFVDSLKTIVREAKEDSVKADALNILAWEICTINPDTALLLSKQALGICNQSKKIADKTKWTQAATSKHQIGWFYFFKGELQQALTLNLEAIALWEGILAKYPDPPGTKIIAGRMTTRERMLSTMGNTAIIYKSKGDYTHALHYFFKVLNAAEIMNDKKRIARQLCNIGVVYSEQGDVTRALDYYFRGLKVAEEIQNKSGIAGIQANIGVAYSRQKDFTKALEYFTKGLNTNIEIGNKREIGIAYTNLGQLYADLGNTAIAFEYLSKAKKNHEEMGDQTGVAITLIDMGQLLFREKKFPEAKRNLWDALSVCQQTGSKEQLLLVYETLAMMDSAAGNFKDAYQEYKMAILYRDSISNEENTKSQTRAEMQYEFDKKEAEIKADQEKKDAVTEAEKKKQRIILWIVGAGLLLVIVFAGFIFRSSRSKQKANVEILRQKLVIEEKQKEVLDSIYYARRIQRSLMPTEIYVQKKLRRLNPGKTNSKSNA
jgi:tetratricopeptide (TPR) repeat protein